MLRFRCEVSKDRNVFIFKVKHC